MGKLFRGFLKSQTPRRRRGATPKYGRRKCHLSKFVQTGIVSALQINLGLLSIRVLCFSKSEKCTPSSDYQLVVLVIAMDNDDTQILQCRTGKTWHEYIRWVREESRIMYSACTQAYAQQILAYEYRLWSWAYASSQRNPGEVTVSQAEYEPSRKSALSIYSRVYAHASICSWIHQLYEYESEHMLGNWSICSLDHRGSFFMNDPYYVNYFASLKQREGNSESTTGGRLRA